MKEKEMIEEMCHQMRCVSGRINITEMEQENQLKGVMISIENQIKVWDIPIILNKKELHRFIGVLLHIQAKLK